MPHPDPRNSITLEDVLTCARLVAATGIGAADLVMDAEVAARWRASTGHAHPLHGAGTLADACHMEMRRVGCSRAAADLTDSAFWSALAETASAIAGQFERIEREERIAAVQGRAA